MSPTFSPVSLGGIGQATYGSSVGATVNNNARPGKTIVAFNGSGSVNVSKAGYVEFLVIGGGGGGGGADGATNISGGGGAGGHLYSANGFLNAGTQTVTVGAGGANSNSYAGFAGTASKLNDYIALPGGSGNGYTGGILIRGSDGASSGGTLTNNTFFRGALMISGQGNVGGLGAFNAGGGGGGAGNAGGTGSGNIAGNGGNGVTYNINGSSVTYCGGGGGQNGTGGTGGTGGSGGGGNGSTSINTAGNSGGANTGGGGGGFASGGSGYVVVVFG